MEWANNAAALATLPAPTKMTCPACHYAANPGMPITDDYVQCEECRRGFSGSLIHTCNGRRLCGAHNGVEITLSPVFEAPKPVNPVNTQARPRVVVMEPTPNIARKGKAFYQLWTDGQRKEWWKVPTLDDAVRLTPDATVRE